MIQPTKRADLVRNLIATLPGEDITRTGVKSTPERVSRAWDEWFSGYDVDATGIVKMFRDGAEKSDQLVISTNIPLYSHCEHHMAPFFGVAHVGYIPSGKICGLSKFARIVDIFSRRLQVQERMTNQIADCISEAAKPYGVGVIVCCRHMCMESRGIRARGTITQTVALRGHLKTKSAPRQEFLSRCQSVASISL